MKKKLLTLSLAAAVVFGGLSGSSVSAATHTVGAGDNIQAVINSATAGDTINVAAGTFTGSLTINKPLTLNGAQAGVDARTRSGAETVLKIPSTGDNFAINIEAAGVTISGFTIDGADRVGSNGIFITPGARENTVVSHNIITKTRVGFYAATGVQLDDFVASYNHFDSNNNTTNGSNAVFLGNITADGIAITNNAFEHTDGQPGVSNAVQVVAANAGDIARVNIAGNSSHNDGSFVFAINVLDISVANNTVSGLAGHGVLIGDGVSGLTVSGNTFSDSASAVRLNGISLGSIEVTDNVISGMTTAGVSIAAATTAGTVIAQGNSFTGNAVGILNESSSVAVTANENWWGCEAGPGASGCDTAEGSVVAAEWYVNSGMTATNLDDEAAPGVPNTAVSDNAVGGPTFAVFSAVVVLVAGAAVMHRYARPQ